MADIAAAMNEHSQGVSLVHETLSATNIFVTASNFATYPNQKSEAINCLFLAI
ncbi:Uncharacterized protein APZ42_009477 [Daphnia magna]|uniref:Uncharacterized protein n=1 Tax=Daphnia magna TaxID=35525 RepID=A0A164DZP0_9CRUS|nr:Uncharacterized protein APZ42_009477 [Daphnia magna]